MYAARYIKHIYLTYFDSDAELPATILEQFGHCFIDFGRTSFRLLNNYMSKKISNSL